MSHVDSLPETISPAKSSITGSFHSEPILMEHYEVPNSNRLVINIHGTFGNMHGSTGKYAEFAHQIAGEGLASTVLYSSSRDWKKSDELDSSYASKIETFRGKIFSNELEDARRVVQDSIDTAKKGLPDWKELEVTLHGNSLGGILAFYLAEEFPEIKAIISVGTGLRTEPFDVPILDTIPSEAELRKVFASYRGAFLMQYGTLDDTFSQEAFESLYQAVWTKEKAYIEYIWVDHAFRSVHGESSDLVFQTATDQLKHFLQTGKLVQWEVRLETPTDTQALRDKYSGLSEKLVSHAWEGVRVSMDDENILYNSSANKWYLLQSLLKHRFYHFLHELFKKDV